MSETKYQFGTQLHAESVSADVLSVSHLKSKVKYFFNYRDVNGFGFSEMLH